MPCGQGGADGLGSSKGRWAVGGFVLGWFDLCLLGEVLFMSGEMAWDLGGASGFWVYGY